MALHHLLTAASATILLLASCTNGAPSQPQKLEPVMGFDPVAAAQMAPGPLAQEINIALSSLETANLSFGSYDPYAGDERAAQVRRDEGKLAVYTARKFPYRTFGRIQRADGVFCSGTLIGPRHVLTARHCMSSATRMTFSPAYDKGDVLPTSWIEKYVQIEAPPEGPDHGWCIVSTDWSIGLLKDRIGDDVGWVGIREMVLAEFKDKNILSTQGYPGNRDGGSQMYVGHGVTVTGTVAPENCRPHFALLGNGESAGGMSGGALWWISNSGSTEVFGTRWGGGQWASVTAPLIALYSSIRKS